MKSSNRMAFNDGFKSMKIVASFVKRYFSRALDMGNKSVCNDTNFKMAGGNKFEPINRVVRQSHPLSFTHCNKNITLVIIE